MPSLNSRFVWTCALVWLAACEAPPGRAAAAADSAGAGTPVDAVEAALPQDSAEVRGSILPSGGSLELPGFASVRFPPGAFTDAQAVSLAATRSAETGLDFETTVPVPPLARGTRELRILTGRKAPLDSVDVTIGVPDEVRRARAGGGEIAAYAQIWQSGG